MADMRTLAVATRQRLTTAQAQLTSIWRQNQHSHELLANRAALVDGILRDLWLALDLPPNMALVAVGGYGRGALYPASDVDLLILQPPLLDNVTSTTSAGQMAAHEEKIAALVSILWDIGLDIGHSVRTVNECLTEAARDITIQTSLLEARYLKIGRASCRERVYVLV